MFVPDTTNNDESYSRERTQELVNIGAKSHKSHDFQDGINSRENGISHQPLNEIDEYVQLGGKLQVEGNSQHNEIYQVTSSIEKDFSPDESHPKDYYLFNTENSNDLPISEDLSRNNNDEFDQESERISGYIRLLTTNRNYLLYLMSHFYRHFGDWFVHVSNIIAVGLLVPDSSTALSILIATKLAANIIFPNFGGAVADSYDRRWVMICLDFLGSLITLGHILAVRKNSVAALCAVSFARASISALYEPVSRSIVPLMVQLQDLKKSAVLNASAWSIMIMLGGTVAGYTIAFFGIEQCYIIDTISYSLSAFTMWLVAGKFNISPISTKSNFESAIDPTQQCPSLPNFCSLIYVPFFQFTTMIKELRLYLRRCGFGICVFIKASGSLSCGASNILNNAFAQVEGNEEATFKRIGYIYSSEGLGSLLGPIIVGNILELKDGKTFQFAIIVGLALQFCGWFGEAMFPTNFFIICIFTALRTAGSATMWVFSSLLFQTLVPADILGRVLAFELAIGVASEAIAVVVAGISKDAGYSNQEVAFGQGLVAFFFFSFWTIYYQIGGGKANQILTQEHKRHARIDYFRYNHFLG